ncbi:hypothetical protein PIB30_107207, partial [Stylosanthes scabra]|nr:hypothetical protein [Stylosanthes scabra]
DIIIEKMATRRGGSRSSWATSSFFPSSILLLLLLPHDSRDSVTALMKTSSPTEHIL